MTDQRSMVVFQNLSAERQKFDYFITGLTGTLFAYIVQTYTPQKLSLAASSAEPIALILLMLSFFFGLKRIEIAMVAMRLNHKSLDAAEKAGELTQAIIDGGATGFNTETGELLNVTDLHKRRTFYMKKAKEVEDKTESVLNKALKYYNCRNFFLVAGFLVILAGKLIQPYFP